MPLHRFYLPTLSRHSKDAQLPAEESQHLTRVLRLKPGDNIRIFDGCGLEREATVKHTNDNAVIVSIGETVSETKESKIIINIGVALLTGRKFDAVVRDATMLGASVITPLLTSRSRSFKISGDNNKLVERWQHIAVASTKQCGRSYLPVISPPTHFSRYVEDQSRSVEQKILLLEPNRYPLKYKTTQLQHLASPSTPRTASIAIGPEGGWTDEEIELAKNGSYLPVTLGTNTLRSETVPTIALSVLRFMWSDF